MALLKIFRDVLGTVFGQTDFGFCKDALPSGIYPLDLEFTLVEEKRFYSPKDCSGIPVRCYEKFGIQYNPTRVSAYALAHFNRYYTGCEESREPFLKMADWFLGQRSGRFEYSFDLGELKAPWISAMAQGEALSVLTRAHGMEPERGYLDHAILAAKPLYTNIEDGGVRSKVNGLCEFLEEYPQENSPHTLNGFLYTLVGILDLVDTSPSLAEQLGLGSLLDTLSQNWRLWDLGCWSAYDLHVSPAGYWNFTTINYHQIHIVLMKYIGEVTGRRELVECSAIWQSYMKCLPNRIKALNGKVKYRLDVPAER